MCVLGRLARGRVYHGARGKQGKIMLPPPLTMTGERHRIGPNLKGQNNTRRSVAAFARCNQQQLYWVRIGTRIGTRVD